MSRLNVLKSLCALFHGLPSCARPLLCMLQFEQMNESNQLKEQYENKHLRKKIDKMPQKKKTYPK